MAEKRCQEQKNRTGYFVWGADGRMPYAPTNRHRDQPIRGIAVKQGYRLILADKDVVLVSEFQLTEHALAAPEAFVALLRNVWGQMFGVRSCNHTLSEVN